MPDGDYEAYNDYDPQGPLLDAVRNCGIDCRGFLFSGDGLFPQKTGVMRRGGKLYAKEGYGDAYKDITPSEK